jgi:hypothetical protein
VSVPSAFMKEILVVGAVLFLSSQANLRSAEQATAVSRYANLRADRATRANAMLDEKTGPAALIDLDASGKTPMGYRKID